MPGNQKRQWTVTTGSREPQDMLPAQGHSDSAFCRCVNTAALHLEATTHARVLRPQAESSRWGSKETFCAWAEVEGASWWWKPEGTVSFLKASDGTKPTLETQVWPPAHKGFIKTCTSEHSLGLRTSISSEARFIINRVNWEDYRIPILCLTKPLKCK